MPFTMRPYRRFPVQCVVSDHALLWSLIVVLVLSSEPAYAEWVKLFSTSTKKGGHTIYSEPGTDSRKGDLVRIWILFDYNTIQTEAGDSFLSDIQQSEFDCAEKRFRLLAYMWYSGNMRSGNVVYTNSSGTNWAPAEPNSIGQFLWKFACGKQ
jgi:surface-adhesin protein E